MSVPAILSGCAACLSASNPASNGNVSLTQQFTIPDPINGPTPYYDGTYYITVNSPWVSTANVVPVMSLFVWNGTALSLVSSVSTWTAQTAVTVGTFAYAQVDSTNVIPNLCADNVLALVTFVNNGTGATATSSPRLWSPPMALCPSYTYVPSLTSTAPAADPVNGPITVFTGSALNITWVAQQLPWTTTYNVTIIGYDANGNAVTAFSTVGAWPATSIGMNGAQYTYVWTVPSVVQPAFGAAFQSIVTVQYDNTGFPPACVSDTFILNDPRAVSGSISVTGPSWGATYVAGSNTSVQVTWTTTGLPGTDQFYINAFYFDLAAGSPNLLGTLAIVNASAGSYNFTVSAGTRPGASYFVQMTHTLFANIQDQSPFFTVLPAGGGGGATVNISAAGSTATLPAGSPLVFGQNLTVSWVLANPVTTAGVSTLNVELWISMLGVPDAFNDFSVAVLASGDPATMGTSAAVQIPASEFSFTWPTYFFRVYLVDQPWVVGNTPYYPINLPGLTFTFPTAASTVTAGSNLAITWTNTLPAPDLLTFDLMVFDLVHFQDQLVVNLGTGVLSSANALTVPTSSGYSSAYYTIYAYDGPTPAQSVVFTQTDYFLLTAPKQILFYFPNDTATAAAPTPYTAGGSLTLLWTSVNMAQGALVDVTLRGVNGGPIVSVIAQGIPNAFVQDWAIPLRAVLASNGTAAWNGTSQALVFRISDSSDPTTYGESTPIAIAPLPASITVNAPAFGVTWNGGSKQSVTWTASGVAAGAQCSVTLYQTSRFLGDSPVVNITTGVPCSQGSLSSQYTVPGNLSSTPLYYVVVQQVGSTLWGRSQQFYIASAPVAGFTAFTTALCANFPVGLPAAWQSSLCATTCSACLTAGGVWVAGVTVQLKLSFTGFVGSDNDLLALQNQVGQFQSVGESLCWPAPTSGPTNSTPVTPTLALGAIPFLTTAINIVVPDGSLTHNATLGVLLNGPGATNCSALSVVTAGFSLDQLPPDTDDNAIISAIQRGMSQSTSTGASNVDVTITSSSFVANATATSGSRLRRLASAVAAPSKRGRTRTVAVSVRVRAKSDSAATTASKGVANANVMVAGRKPAVLAAPAAKTTASSNTAGRGAPAVIAKPAPANNRPLTGNNVAALAKGTRNDGTRTFVTSAVAARTAAAALPSPAPRGGGGGGGGGIPGSTSSSGLTSGQRIGLGVGLGVGVPVLLLAVLLIVRACTNTKQSAKVASEKPPASGAHAPGAATHV